MQTGFCHGLSPEWEQHSDLGKEEGYKLCQLAFPNKMKPCGKWNPFHSEKCPKPSVSPAPIQRLPPVSMVVILAAAVGCSLSKLMKKNICNQNNNKKKENINANNGTISQCCQSNICVTQRFYTQPCSALQQFLCGDWWATTVVFCRKKRRRRRRSQKRTKQPQDFTSTSSSCQLSPREKTALTTYYWLPTFVWSFLFVYFRFFLIRLFWFGFVLW